MKFVSSCLDVDPAKRPTTGDLLTHHLFTHDDFNSWFLTDLRSKLQEEFGANPLLRKKKHLYSASRQKSGSEEFQNKKNREKSTVINPYNIITTPTTMSTLIQMELDLTRLLLYTCTDLEKAASGASGACGYFVENHAI